MRKRRKGLFGDLEGLGDLNDLSRVRDIEFPGSEPQGQAMPIRSIPQEMKLKTQPTKSKKDKGKDSN